MDIEEFYEADERRRRSAEVELGTEWRDASGLRYEVSWIADTGELYAMREPAAAMAEDPFGDVFRARVSVDGLTVGVIGWIPDRARLDTVLDGWENAMAQEDSVSWLTSRLREAAVPSSPPAT